MAPPKKKMYPKPKECHCYRPSAEKNPKGQAHCQKRGIGWLGIWLACEYLTVDSFWQIIGDAKEHVRIWQSASTRINYWGDESLYIHRHMFNAENPGTCAIQRIAHLMLSSWQYHNNATVTSSEKASHSRWYLTNMIHPMYQLRHHTNYFILRYVFIQTVYKPSQEDYTGC